MKTRKEVKEKNYTRAERDLIGYKKIRKNGGKVKEVFDKAVALTIAGEKPNMAQLHRDVGYSERSSLCLKAMQTATWKQLKDTVPKNEIMAKWCELAFEQEDKRVNVAALENLGRILGLYEANKLKIETFNEKTSEFLEEVE
ncbi:MAG: hypothetical protein PHR29_05175 [Acholeplasmataceae bacterium]|nr:hypothetical protein [Acholeplasmataceae bacterium]